MTHPDPGRIEPSDPGRICYPRSGMGSSGLAAAIEGRPWCLGAVVHGLQMIVDADGRPLSERRAPIAVREGAPMDMRTCPYDDGREDGRMNVSALAQISAHLDDVTADIASVRASLGTAPTTWLDVYTVVLDQLARAAVYLLRERSATGPIPTPIAVGYKVAAGYATPAHEMLALEARGQGREVTVDSLLGLVRERDMLVGAREVCAGPPNMLERVTRAILHGDAGAAAPVSPTRMHIARTFALQAHIGIVWRAYDLATEWRLLVSDIGAGALSPRTQYLRRMIDERMAELDGAAPPLPPGELPADLTPEHRDALGRALIDRDDDDDLAAAIAPLLHTREGAIELANANWPEYARLFGRYLRAYSTVIGVLWDLEREIRRALDYPLDVPVQLHAAVFPMPIALPWLEMIVGYRVRTTPLPPLELTLRSVANSVTLPAG